MDDFMYYGLIEGYIVKELDGVWSQQTSAQTVCFFHFQTIIPYVICNLKYDWIRIQKIHFNYIFFQLHKLITILFVDN